MRQCLSVGVAGAAMTRMPAAREVHGNRWHMGGRTAECHPFHSSVKSVLYVMWEGCAGTTSSERFAGDTVHRLHAACSLRWQCSAPTWQPQLLTADSISIRLLEERSWRACHGSHGAKAPGRPGGCTSATMALPTTPQAHSLASGGNLRTTKQIRGVIDLRGVCVPTPLPNP